MKMKRPNNQKRRKFLKTAGITLAGGMLACGGLTFAATRQPKINLPVETLGEETPMNQKILVTYATRAGSTAEVAQKIGQILAAQGAAVDILPVKDVQDVTDYKAVVIGSAIRFGTVLPEAVKFLEQNREALNSKSTAFFVVHLLNQGEEEASQKARLAYLDAARNLVTLKSEACFAGVGDLTKVSFLERMIGKAVKSPEGDFRNWDEIIAWAESLNNSR